jgi:uncharacterized protein involved in exopolysaccharide biosynthesis
VLLIERGNLLRTYHSDSSKVRRISKQIETTQRDLKREVNSYTNDQKSQLKTLNDTLSSLENRLIELNNNNINVYSNLLLTDPARSKLNVLTTSYETLTRRLAEVRMASSEINSLFSVSLLEKPYYSGQPYFPNILLIPFGILAGFVLGLSLGFLREFFDHTIKRPEDVSNTLKVPTLFSIPRWE